MADVASVPSVEDEIRVIKQGETLVDAVLYRSWGGLSMSVKAVPQIEEFMKSLGSGEGTDVRNFGRYWTNKDPKIPLLIYDMAPNLCPNPTRTNKGSFRLDQVGLPLVTHAAAPGGTLETCVNLAFLRLVGISSGHGVEFRISGVYEEGSVKRMRESILEASEALWRTYMKPMAFGMQLQLSSQDIPL